jgi:hypothetical protein
MRVLSREVAAGPKEVYIIMMGHMFGDGYYGDWNSAPEGMRQMMQSYYGGLRPFGTLYGLMHFLTWILLMALLVSLIRYIWLKAEKK